jgi:hypothetical protein
VESSSPADFAPAAEKSQQGHVLFLRGQTLMAQWFDAARLRLDGAPFAVADSIASTTSGIAAFSVSATGVLAYRIGRDSTQLLWFDREGRASGSAHRAT